MFVALLAGASDWQSAESLRSVLPRDARPVAHWRGRNAAFLAASVPAKNIQSVVRVDGGGIEVLFDGAVRTAAKGNPVTSLDLEGILVGDAVILFHTETRLASSALSFDTGKVDAQKLRFLVTGLAPGVWEVWRNGWVVDPGVTVRAREAVLYFEERPGSYFIRRLQ